MIQDDFLGLHPSEISIASPFSLSSEESHISVCDDSSTKISSSAEESVNDNTTSDNSSSASIFSSIDMNEPFPNYDLGDYDPNSECSEQLYDTSEISVSQSLAILFNWYCSFPGISKEAFSRLLYLLNSFLLPNGNKLPNSYARAKSLIKDLLVPVQNYDCCSNDCIVFRNSAKGDFKDLDVCPKCGTTRYQPCTTVAKKQFKYIPLAPRLKRMYADKRISEILQNHLKEDVRPKVKQSMVLDLHQSFAWKSRYAVNGPFQGDPRGVSLSLCTDGTNPFSKEKVSYSMWPIMLTVLNLPRHTRNLHESIILAGIIPGKLEPQNLDPYMEILADEITSINGSLYFDAYQGEHFKMQLDIMMHVLDYPGQNKLFHCGGKSYYIDHKAIIAASLNC